MSSSLADRPGFSRRRLQPLVGFSQLSFPVVAQATFRLRFGKHRFELRW
jgi:hypothetical protein